MKQLLKSKSFWIVTLLCLVTLFPFLGLTDYHTKGEPRESVVSYSILETGNWILSRNNGGEMAYKPPFFHWCIAAASIVRGAVTEGSSRVPSAAALTLMTIAGFLFYGRRKGVTVGVVASLVTFTSFELHRAGTNCRVDMVLTAMTVIAIYDLYKWYEQKMHGIPWLAILCMGLATMTKGPVGSIIPCLIIGIFMLIRGVNFFKTFLTLALFGLISLIFYGIWFYSAYKQGGHEFLFLMNEENIGRMTNTMTYNSNVQPWPMNFVYIILGYIPWILIPIIGLFFLKKTSFVGIGKSFFGNEKWLRFKTMVRKTDDVDLYSVIALLTVLVFYCIPQSKRSVYLMPLYPFLGYFIAKMLLWINDNKPAILRIYGGFLAVISSVLFLLIAVLQMNILPDTLLGGHKRHIIENVATMQAFSGALCWWQYVIIIITTAAGIYWWRWQKRTDIAKHLVYGLIGLTLALYLSLDAVYSPLALNVKSQKPVAVQIDKLAPSSKGTLYEYIDAGVKAKGDPLHFFELNFYLGNRIGNFYREHPKKGFLIIPDGDFENLHTGFEKQGYKFKFIKSWPLFEYGLYSFSK
nr:glycosyltransferase family 39 protein [Prevotella sp.]